MSIVSVLVPRAILRQIASHSQLQPLFYDLFFFNFIGGFLGGASSKKSTCQCRRRGFNPWVRKMPWRRKWQPTPAFLPREPHGQRSLSRLQSMRLQRHDWRDLAHTSTQLTYNVSFRHTAKWISYAYTCIHSFLDSFPCRPLQSIE